MQGKQGELGMESHKMDRRSFAGLRLVGQGDRIHASFASIAEPCLKQPAPFYEVRHGTKAPLRTALRYFRLAFDAAKTPEARRQVVERITACLLEVNSHVWSWLWAANALDRRDVFEPAQQADGEEDVAETVFLMNPTPSNAQRLIEAGRLERVRSEQRERYLLSQCGRTTTDTRPAA